MQVVLTVMFIVIIAVAIFYFYEFERACDEIYRLNCKLDEYKYSMKKLNEKYADTALIEQKAMEHIEKLAYIKKMVFQDNNLNSIENLKNKIKTVLDDVEID